MPDHFTAYNFNEVTMQDNPKTFLLLKKKKKKSAFIRYIFFIFVSLLNSD